MSFVSRISWLLGWGLGDLICTRLQENAVQSAVQVFAQSLYYGDLSKNLDGS